MSSMSCQISSKSASFSEYHSSSEFLKLTLSVFTFGGGGDEEEDLVSMVCISLKLYFKTFQTYE